MNFRAVLALPKTAGSAQAHKVWVSFELFGVLGIYNFASFNNIMHSAAVDKQVHSVYNIVV